MRESSTRKSARSPVYHSVSRTRTESSMALSRSRITLTTMLCRAVRFVRIHSRRFARKTKEISRSPPRVQQWLTLSRVNLSSYAIHIHLDQIRKRIEALVPHVLGNFRATYHAPSIACQKLDQRVLLGRHRNASPRARNALRASVQHQVRHRDLRRTQFSRAPQQRAQSRQQLAKLKWLG